MVKVFLTIFLVLIPINAWCLEKLVFAIDIVRHGDRTPIFLIPASPSYNWQGRGQLTAEGMQQQYQLGTQLRKKYIDQYHLLPNQYNGETMYVRSSDYDRTLMSAESLLMGLYPLGTGPYLSNSKQPALPQAYQPIPIHTLPQKQDLSLIPRKDREKFKALLKKYVFLRAEWKEKNAQLRDKYPIWSKATGVHITNLYQLISIGSTLHIQQLHHAPLPQGLNPADVKDIISAGKWALATSFKPKEVGNATGRELLNMIANYLKQAMQHESPLKYVLISGHDATILSVMSALGVPLVEPPDYASDLNLALYEVGPAKYAIKITYKDESVTIPDCKSSICSISVFMSKIISRE